MGFWCFKVFLKLKNLGFLKPSSTALTVSHDFPLSTRLACRQSLEGPLQDTEEIVEDTANVAESSLPDLLTGNLVSSCNNCSELLQYHRCADHTHTHTHPFNGPLSRTTRVSRYQKGKTNLDFTEARDRERQWHQLGHMQVCTSLQTDNDANTSPLSFLQAGCPSCCPANSVKALKAVC